MLPTNPEAREFYVYLWWNDDEEKVFYVGKGTKDRYKDKCERNQWFTHIINKHKCHPEIIINNLTSDEALKAEREVELILRKNGVELTNATPCGGQPPTASGPDNPNYGNHWSDDKKAEVGKKMRDTKCHAGARNGRATKTMIVETGEIFDTIKDCAARLNTSTTNINASITRNGLCRGYHIVKLSAQQTSPYGEESPQQTRITGET